MKYGSILINPRLYVCSVSGGQYVMDHDPMENDGEHSLWRKVARIVSWLPVYRVISGTTIWRSEWMEESEFPPKPFRLSGWVARDMPAPEDNHGG